MKVTGPHSFRQYNVFVQFVTNHHNDNLKNVNASSFPHHLLSTVPFSMSNSTLHAHLKNELNACRFPSDHHELVIHIQAVLFHLCPRGSDSSLMTASPITFQKNV